MNRSVPISTTPKLLQTLNWILDPTGYMTTNTRRHGDLYKAPIFGHDKPQACILSDPKELQSIFSRDSGTSFSSPGELNEILAPMLGRHNVIMLSGEEHRQRRRLVMPPFHGDHLQDYGRVIERITRKEIDQWNEGDEIRVREVMQRISMKIILHVVFGLEEGERFRALDRLLRRRLGMTATPLTSLVLFFPWLQKDLGAWSVGGRIGRLAGDTDALLFAEIAERRAQLNRDRKDVLSLLLAARDEQGEGLSDQDLRDELMTLLVAGHETTATVLTAGLYWLHRCDQPRQALLQELDALGDDADAAHLVRLPYLTAVSNESLRLHPVAMLTFARQVDRPVECCGYPLERGDLVTGSIYLLHQREDLYPDPGEFRPERFLERCYSPYEFMPFGAGVRRCVGAALAQYELKIVLGTLLRDCELALLNTRPVRQARRGVTLGHRTAVRMRYLGRRDRHS